MGHHNMGMDSSQVTQVSLNLGIPANLDNLEHTHHLAATILTKETHITIIINIILANHKYSSRDKCK